MMLRKFLLTLGCLCLLAAFMPWWSTFEPTASVQRRELSIGVPSVPCFRRVEQRTNNADGAMICSTDTFFWLSPPSALALVVGIGLIVAPICKKREQHRAC